MSAKPSLPQSLWAATAIAPGHYPEARGNITVQTVVVGAGYTGLSAALHLAAAGQNVLVLESAEPGWGASGRNGGQIISGLKINPDELEAMFGAQAGARMALTMGTSSELVYSLIDRYGIECHDRRTGWIQAAHAPVAMDDMLRKRFAQWNARGVDSKLLDRDQAAAMIGCAPGNYVGAWVDPRGGVLQPMSWARGLAAAVVKEGGRIAANSPVTRLREEGNRWVVETPAAVVSAERVLLATNAYTDHLWPGLRQTVVPVSSFQAATVPLPEDIRKTILPGGQGVTDTRRLLHYFRLDHTGRLVMGGRSPVDDDPTLADADSLRRAIARTFPQAAGVPLEFVWSGKVALTKDSLPHIHILAPNLFTALGCNGRGVANAAMLGKLLASLATGTPPGELAIPVTAPDRFLFHAFQRVGVLAAATYYRVLDQLETQRRGTMDTWQR
ncbi:NAD(P)/FAD-dependent oxidoreductase [Cupriavidus sp. 8B]